MNFKIKRIKLINALSKTTKAVSIRSPLPVLTGIKFDLHDDCLILTGSDSDISIEAFISQEDEKNNLTIDQAGSIVLQARFFSEIVKKLPDEISRDCVSFIEMMSLEK